MKLPSMHNLLLSQRLTALLSIVFAVSMLVSGIFVTITVDRTARQEISSKALMLMETMTSVRDYTNTRIKPQLQDRMEREFLPESVPSFSAATIFNSLRKNPDYSEFLYREVAINPTNLADKTDAFETAIVERFRANPALKEETGFRTDAPHMKGNVFYIARPTRIEQQSCLQCHSTPQNAPKSMIAKYGDKNGFNWKLHETIGSQMIFVPADRILTNARNLFISIMGITLVIFGLTMVMVNIWLRGQVVKPIVKIVRIVEAISMGDLSMKLDSARGDEIGKLAQAIDRLSLSLQMAMRRIQTPSK